MQKISIIFGTLNKKLFYRKRKFLTTFLVVAKKMNLLRFNIKMWSMGLFKKNIILIFTAFCRTHKLFRTYLELLMHKI